MTWVKIDDLMPTNPKVIGLSDKGFRLYVAGICFASANKSDGEIPPQALPILNGNARLAAELVAAGLWETTSRKGWQIHDYLKYNRSRATIESTSEARSKAGSKGLANRWQIAKQIASSLPLSGSGSRNPDINPDPSVSLNLEEEQEQQNASKLPDSTYRQIDSAWIQSAGTTLPRIAGERFESYALRAPLEWVLDAIAETGHANKKDPRYTYAILDNWLRDGREQAPVVPGNQFKESRILKQIAAAKERQ